jgi:hypothetical protein
MRHFLFEEQEYRVNIRFRRKRNEQDSAKALARLLRHKGPYRHSGGGGGSRRTDARQKCVAKMQYSSSLKAHRLQLEQYLVREGTERDGSRAVLYGTDREEYKQNMAERNFRIFLSPQSGEADLKGLAEGFVKRLEKQTGYKLYWQAANHYNTAHPHAHLLINGVDKTGKEIIFPKDIVKTFMRETARDLCTAQLGCRTRKEIELEKERELTSPRYTRLDKRIKELCSGGYRVDLSILGTERQRVLARLEYLRKIKLCVYREGGYKLASTWEEDLRASGRYNVFLKARGSLVYSTPSRFKVYSGAQGQISGKVTKIYRTDEDASDNHAVILESVDGRAYFVPFLTKPEAKGPKGGMPVKEGDFITLKAYKSQKGRLTPFLFLKEAKEFRREIKKGGLTGSLAAEILGFPDAKRRQKEVTA